MPGGFTTGEMPAARSRLRRLLALGSVLGVAALLVLPPLAWRLAPGWSLEGFAMTLCPCDTPCPCRSGGAPTHDGCLAATFVDVVHGRYGDLALDGSRFVTLGDMRGSGERVVYFDAATPAAVRDALAAIGRRMLVPPGPLAPWLALLAPDPAVLRAVPGLAYAASAGGIDRHVTIPGVLELHARLQAGPDGVPRAKVPALDELSNWIAYADNLVYRYDGPDLPPVDFSGRQADFKTFAVTRADYDEGRMLFQHAASDPASLAALRARLDTVRTADELAPEPFRY
jgi:hypothetical protein